MTTNDEILIRSLQALGKNTPNHPTIERELAELHAAYAAIEEDPASLAQLDALLTDAAFDLRDTNVTSDNVGNVNAILQSHDTVTHWIARPDCRSILVVVPHLQALSRLLDVLPLVEIDHRVQVVFTTPTIESQPSGVTESVHNLGGLLVPWSQALRTRFDLILAADHYGIQDLTGPTMLLAHDVDMIRSRTSPQYGQALHDLHRRALMSGDEVVPTALALDHEEELAVLADSCPQVMPRAVVTGDPSFDRVLASRPHRQRYRKALGVRDCQRLVVVSTMWSSHSLFGTDPGIFVRLMADLPADDYRVIGVLHPFVWHAHGRRQVLAWLAEARAAGLRVVQPEEDWRAAVVSADLVVGDHGSMTHYAAGLDVPVLMHADSLADTPPGGMAASLAQLATPLYLDRPLRRQIERAIADHIPQHYSQIADLITSRPGQSGTILRRALYRLLNLPEPSNPVHISAVPQPKLIPQLSGAA